MNSIMGESKRRKKLDPDYGKTPDLFDSKIKHTRMHPELDDIYEKKMQSIRDYFNSHPNEKVYEREALEFEKLEYEMCTGKDSDFLSVQITKLSPGFYLTEYVLTDFVLVDLSN